jgi:hypothetical protein
MALNLGFPIWNSNNGIICSEQKAPIVCATNARPAYLEPRYYDGVNETQWVLNDNVYAWGTGTGNRNGIAVDINGVTYVWDVQGDASSDEVENSPFAKLASFLELCKDCEDCDNAGVATLAGEYEWTYPALPSTSFCYNLTVTSVTDYPTARDIQIVEMSAGTYLVGAVKVVSYNAGTDTAVYRICLSQAVTSSGSPIGFPTNYTFASV